MASLIRDLAASTPEMLAAFGDEALVRAALDFEAALAAAEAEEGLLTAVEAGAIGEACVALPDIGTLADAVAHAGTLAIPLVAELRRRAAERDPGTAAKVHLGATSQDLADTALMLQAKAGWTLIRRDGARLTRAFARLADVHCATPMLGRTLLQPARPITFGLKAANWVLSVDAALARLDDEALSALQLQFGGASGARDGLSGRGAAVARRLAERLGLGDPPLPWHARREGVAGLASALAILAGALGKIAGDIVLMAQAEIGEAFEPLISGRGGSSAMAHKRNPTGCQTALSAALRAPHLAATILSAAAHQQHERGVGGWQAEAPVLAELFAIAHGALFAMAAVAEGLEVHPERMAANLTAARVGQDVGESVALAEAALAAVADRR